MAAEHPEITSTEHSVPVELNQLTLDDDGFDSRYEIKKLLGEGGMSEVYGCKDHRLGRDVAMKVLDRAQGAKAEQLARFLREARVQGQLEHPSIVPVYDIGRSPYGATYFTMRRVRGQTLLRILKDLHDQPQLIDPRYSRRKLLEAFDRLCLAVDYAHRRGVLHCDIKPSNIMLGDFGEVVLLDWGLARISSEPVAAQGEVDEARIVGTPGYMAPEQIRNLPTDGRADVYALGAILFEMLTLEPLHLRTSTKDALRSTLGGVADRRHLIAREKDMPPELEEICTRATRRDPEKRFENARDLQAAVERYLDGDRDAELRVRLSIEQAERAIKATKMALDANLGDAGIEQRRNAMRAVSRSLALDPENRTALGAFSRLLLEPVERIPDEIRREAQSDGAGLNRASSNAGAMAYLSLLLFAPLTFWMGVRDWVSAVTVIGLILVASVVVFGAGRVGRRKLFAILVAFSFSTIAIGALSLIAGPFILIPAMAGANTLAYAMQVPKRHRIGVTIAGCFSILGPVILELLGWLPDSYRFSHGTMTALPRMHYFPEGPTYLFLLLSSLGMVIIPTLYIGRFRDEQDKADARLRIQAWHLRQFLSDPPSSTPPSQR